MHFVYVLISNKDQSYYIGETPDINRRMLFHNQLGHGYTSKKRPWVIHWVLEVSDRTTAKVIKKYLKKKSRSFKARLRNDPNLTIYITERFCYKKQP